MRIGTFCHVSLSLDVQSSLDRFRLDVPSEAALLPCALSAVALPIRSDSITTQLEECTLLCYSLELWLCNAHAHASLMLIL